MPPKGKFNAQFLHCRICLIRTRKVRSIFESSQPDKLPPNEMLRLLTGVIVDERIDKNLPRVICTTCERSLNIAYDFRLLAIQSDEIISQYRARNSLESVVIALDDGKQYKLSKELTLKIIKKHEESREAEDVHNENRESFVADDINDCVNEEHLSQNSDSTSNHSSEVRASNDMTKNIQFYGFSKNSKLNQNSHQVITLKVSHPNQDSKDSSDEEEIEIEIDPLNFDNGSIDDDSRLRIKQQASDCNDDKITDDHINPTYEDNCDGSDNGEAKTAENAIQHLLKKEKNRKVIASKKFIVRQNGGSKTSDSSRYTRKYMCEICGNSYLNRAALTIHLNHHNDEKPYKCEICSKGFLISEGLRRHILTHGAEKPYQCRHCERRFFNPSSRKYHELVHTGVKPHVCYICKKGFSYSCSLQKHLMTHSDEKMYRCVCCELDFRLPQHLKQHQQSLKHKSNLKMWTKNQ